MASKVLNFSNFTAIFEGGQAIKTSRRIREDEFSKTLEDIQEKLFPLLGLDPASKGEEFTVIGSIGKKANPSDTSGDLDIGYNGITFARRNAIDYKQCSKKVYEILQSQLAEELGYKAEMKLMSGLNIVSVAWPIEGDQTKGFVQLDLIPLSDMDWAQFIYYSPDYKKSESAYKSAHRNWLLAAILSARKNILTTDEQGEVMNYEKPVLILSDGLYWHTRHTKSYKGTRIPRLKHSKKIEGSERFVTNDPQEFIDFALGPGYTPNDVKTFEQVLKIVEDPGFDLNYKLPGIKETFLEYLERVGLEIPSEINRTS
jgi:hypothetical protein